MTLRFPHLVFDFDGTLVDSAVGMAACMNELLGDLGRKSLTANDVALMVGDGIPMTVRRAMEATGDVPGDLADQVEKFKALYYRQAVEETPLYDGVLATLEVLDAKGYVMALCTNKVYDATMRLLEGIGIARFFKAVAGGDSYPVCKPHPDHLYGVMEAMGATTDNTVLIGDSPNDIDCAKNAGVRSIAVSYGYSKVPPAELGADALIEHFNALPKALDTLA
jgi:phosphoglycolate phosphatase